MPALTRLDEEAQIVSPCPVDAPRGLPDVTQADAVWDELYGWTTRRLIRVHGRSKNKRRWVNPVGWAAAVMADYAMWQAIPAVDRPPGWPVTIHEFAARVGWTVSQLKATAARIRLRDWVERSPFNAAGKIEELDRRLYDRAVEELSATEYGKASTKAAELWYKRVGAIKPAGIEVQVGPRVQNTLVVNGGAASEEDLRARLKRFTEESQRYLARAEVKEVGHVEVVGEPVPVERGEVSPGADRAASQDGEPAPR